jgi:hypothetical protein
MLLKSVMPYIYTLKTKRFSLINPNNLNKQKHLLKLCLCARELKKGVRADA